MPSFADSAVIFILALILFGPKKLPQLARQLGKLMAEFRRASNEFRMQMEDELRIEEQKEHQKKVDAMAGPPSTLPEPEHPHLPSTTASDSSTAGLEPDAPAGEYHAETVAGPAPIAESGSLRMMPPSTGLPVSNGAFTGRDADFTYHDGDGSHENSENNGQHAIPEHSVLPPASATNVGMSSEEPMEETRPATTHEAVHSA